MALSPRAYLMAELAALADALFPPACALCGARARGSACDAHAFADPEQAPRCGRCAVRLAPMLPDGYLCSGCRLDPPRWAALAALADYEGGSPARDWILALKHGGRSDLARPLGEFLAQRVLRAGFALPADAVVTAVPLHLARRFARGYDQARQLARALARELGLPFARTLRRLRATPPQGAPGSVSRAANVRGAFELARGARARFDGRTVLLVDDVVTSGSTANECARCLRAAGAAAVYVACLARASPRPHPASGPDG